MNKRKRHLSACMVMAAISIGIAGKAQAAGLAAELSDNLFVIAPTAVEMELNIGPEGISNSSEKPVNPGESRGFNPQPDPPGKGAGSEKSGPIFMNNGAPGANNGSEKAGPIFMNNGAPGANNGSEKAGPIFMINGAPGANNGSEKFGPIFMNNGAPGANNGSEKAGPIFMNNGAPGADSGSEKAGPIFMNEAAHGAGGGGGAGKSSDFHFDEAPAALNFTNVGDTKGLNFTNVGDTKGLNFTNVGDTKGLNFAMPMGGFTPLSGGTQTLPAAAMPTNIIVSPGQAGGLVPAVHNAGNIMPLGQGAGAIMPLGQGASNTPLNLNLGGQGGNKPNIQFNQGALNFAK